MIAVALLAIMFLACIATGLQVWLSQNPAWAWFKSCLAGLASASVLMIILLGKDFGWWSFDSQISDILAPVWAALTFAGVFICYWILR